VLLPEWMRITQGYYLIVYAAAVMVMMAFCPYGVLGMVAHAFKAVAGRSLPQAAWRTESGSP
jgi:branched-chain amino acid transport system permease protein